MLWPGLRCALLERAGSESASAKYEPTTMRARAILQERSRRRRRRRLRRRRREKGAAAVRSLARSLAAAVASLRHECAARCWRRRPLAKSGPEAAAAAAATATARQPARRLAARLRYARPEKRTTPAAAPALSSSSRWRAGSPSRRRATPLAALFASLALASRCLPACLPRVAFIGRMAHRRPAPGSPAAVSAAVALHTSGRR